MSSPSFLSFPKDFLWGASTSSFQIEGCPLWDGAVPSNWLRWTQTPGRIQRGENADSACDHYHRWREDVALMKEMGLTGYRLSLSWPRIVPARGCLDPQGLGFYRRLLEELRQAGITPLVTLHHWEVPLWAEGGWERRETALAFGEFAEDVFRTLGPLVPYWATINEPEWLSKLGYLSGEFPPGLQDKAAWVRCVHNLNLAHALAVRAFRASGQKGEIGWALALTRWIAPSSDPAEEKHRRKMDDLHTGVFLDPSEGRGYPDTFYDFGGETARACEKTVGTLAEPSDFLGANHYGPNYSKLAPAQGMWDNAGASPAGSRLNDMGWSVDPEGFYHVLSRYWKDYRPRKIVVTENGLPTRGSLWAQEGLLEDDVRVHFLGTYIAQMKRAMDEGVPVAGYFTWSLMDNFEWCQGYDPRFGLVHVDFATQKRTLKKSARWYQSLIAARGFDTTLLPKDPTYRIQEG